MIDQALRAIESGKLVAIPTETVYGLAAPINNLELVKKIFSLKKRPLFDPLIVHVASINMAKRYCEHWSPEAQLLADTFWPGPLTLVLEKKESVHELVTAGLSTVGLRVPRHRLGLEFIESLDTGVAAPSANTFTKTSPTKVEHVKKYFSDDDVFILDGGDCSVGIESTIVHVEKDRLSLLRPGMLSIQEIKERTGLEVLKGVSQLEKVSPGSHRTHYRPDYPLVVVKTELSQEDLRKWESDYKGKGLEISYKESPQIIARTLYSELHKPLLEGHSFKILDFSKCFNNYPAYEWEALFNRIEKAASYIQEV